MAEYKMKKKSETIYFRFEVSGPAPIRSQNIANQGVIMNALGVTGSNHPTYHEKVNEAGATIFHLSFFWPEKEEKYIREKIELLHEKVEEHNKRTVEQITQET